MRLVPALAIVSLLGGCPIEINIPDGSIPDFDRDAGAPEHPQRGADSAGSAAPSPDLQPGSDGAADGGPAPGQPHPMDQDQRGPGHVRLYLAAVPAELGAVMVTVGRIEASVAVGAQEDWFPLIGAPHRVDLRTLRNGMTALLGQAMVPPGSYRKLRIWIADASLVVAGQERPLFISPAAHSVQIDVTLDVESRQSYAVVLELDAPASIEHRNAGLMLTPVLRVKEIKVVHGDDSSGDPSEADAGAEDASDGPGDGHAQD